MLKRLSLWIHVVVLDLRIFILPEATAWDVLYLVNLWYTVGRSPAAAGHIREIRLRAGC